MPWLQPRLTRARAVGVAESQVFFEFGFTLFAARAASALRVEAQPVNGVRTLLAARAASALRVEAQPVNGVRTLLAAVSS